MKSVTRFEWRMLRILQFLLGRLKVSQVHGLLTGESAPPKCLSREAVALVEATLTQGCIGALVEQGAWMPQRFLRDGQACEGRLWQRTPPEQLGLPFSAFTLKVLVRMTAVNLAEARQSLPLKPRELGDLYLLFLIRERLKLLPALQTTWWRGKHWASHGLCRLMFPDLYAGWDDLPDPDFEPWMTAGGAAILETLQPRLAARYIEMERSKGAVVEPQRMLRLGVEQERVLSCYWEAIDRAGRRDLSRFALEAAEHLLHPGVEIQQWNGQLQISSVPRLADRSAVYQASLAFLKQLRRLADWNRQATGTAYYDDHYASSQFWKTQWEAFQGEASASMAERMIRVGDPISA